jgi:kumamolisin
MSYTSSSDSILIDLPPSLNKEQIQVFPLVSNITTSPLLTAPKISTAYNIPASTGSNVKVGIISLGGGFSQTDLNNSMSDLGLTAPTITFVGVDGATNDYTGDPAVDGENSLDLVCVAGMVPNANIILYKGLNQSITYNTDANVAAVVNSTTSFANTIQRAVDDNCDIISISWGTSEKLISANVTYYCGDGFAGPLGNAAAKGITVFVAAGDYGSQAVNSTNPVFQIVSTDYPAVNANVIAVGGTYLTLTGSNTRSSETVYNNSESISGFGGGGGVSSMISKPTWQANLNYKTYPANTTSTLSSRGIPDISAAMNAYGVWISGNVYGFSGTSASAPIMAGMVARFISLNGGRRPPPESLNSIFYQNTGSFLDITTGNNASLLANGYASTTGWDAVTGLGPQSNAIQTYQSVTSAGLRVKTIDGWQTVQNISIKTGASTWTTVNKVWTKTASGWEQTY